MSGNFDPDEDIDDKAIARAKQQQAASVMTTISDDESEEQPQMISLPPKLPVQQQVPAAVGDTATENRQEYNVDSTAEPVPVAQTKPIYSVSSTVNSLDKMMWDKTMWASMTADKRSVVNEMYAVRRASTLAHRLGALHGDRIELPINATNVQPVLQLLPDPTKLRVGSFTESSGSINSLVALEYGSAFLSDNLVSYNQGDEFGFGFSDTHIFSDGRAVLVTEDPNDPSNVPPKRLATADDDDISPQTLEAANYQHSFFPSLSRYDAVLPVYAFAKLVEQDASIDNYVAKLKTINKDLTVEDDDSRSIDTDVADFLSRSRSGVAPLFSVLSSAITKEENGYTALRLLADANQVAANLATTLEQAQAADASGINIDDKAPQNATAAGNKTAQTAERAELLAAYECLSNIEDFLAESAEGAELPHMVRVRSSGPFTVVGSLIEYDLNRPVGSLVDAATGSMATPDDWNMLEPLLANRERNGVVFDAVKNSWRQRMLQESKSIGVNLRLQKKEEIQLEREMRKSLKVDEFDATMNVRKRVADSESKKKQRSSTSASDSDETANEPKKRRLQKKSDTISSEAKPGKRKASDDAKETVAQGDDDAESGSNEEPGEDIEDDPEDADQQEKDLLEEDFELGEDFDTLRIGKDRKNKDKLTALRTVDPTAVGYLDVKVYQFPMIAVPIGWSCVEALRSLTTQFKVAERPDLLWKSASAWKLIIELAVYCKLVPSMRTPLWFPLEARSKLLYTLEVLSLRVTNEVTRHADNRKVFLQLVDNRRASLQKEIRTIKAKLAQKQTSKNETERQEAAKRLPFAEEELERHRNNNNLSRAALPSLLSIDVATESDMQHLDSLRGEMQGVLFNETQRLALAIAYATAGVRHEKAQSLMQTIPLAKAQTQVADELLYPQDISYRTKLGEMVGNQSTNIVSVLLQFAQLTNTVQKVTENESRINDQTAAAFLDRLVTSLEQDPTMFTQTRKSLAQALYPELLRRRRVNEIKHVYVVPPSLASVESFRTASKMMAYIFSGSGVFTTEALVELYERELSNIAKRAKDAAEIRGSERLIASAAQRYVNEFAPPSRFSLDDVALVPADFTMNSHVKPVGVFTLIDNDAVVDRKQTLELLSSDAFLGGGRVAVSSAAVAPTADDAIAKTTEKIKQVRKYIDEATSESASVDQADEDAVEATQAQLDSANEYLQQLLRQLQNAIPSGANEKTRGVPFFYVVSPSTLFDICSRVVASATPRFDVSACQKFITWYRSPDAEVLYPYATYQSLVQYNRFLVESFAPALMSALNRAPTLLVDTPAQLSRDEFVSLVVAALITSSPRLPVVREETTRTDAVTTQPFSDLAGLELATGGQRESIRQALMNAWYELSDQYRWSKLGYMRMPFNTSFSLGLLPANLNNGAYSTYQTLHLAIRHALRVLQNVDDSGVDEGDSDDESTKTKTTEQLTSERVRGVLQLRTLLNALVREVSRVQVGATLWFDLFGIGGKADEFGAKVSSGLATIYSTLKAGRDVATINLLASRPSSKTQPLALDSRAQDLINSYWRNYASTNAEVEQHNDLNDLYYEQYADDTQTFFAIVDSAFDKTAARQKQAVVAASYVDSYDVETARQVLDDKIDAAKKLSAAERKEEKTGLLNKIPSYVETLVELETKEAKNDTTLDKLDAVLLNTGAFEDDDERKRFAAMNADEQQKRRTKAVEARTTIAEDIAKLQKQIRAAYKDDDKRKDRIDALLEEIPVLAAAIRDGTASRIDVDPTDRLRAYQAELRATIYDDERPQYEANVNKLIEENEVALSRIIAQRVTISMMNELDGQVRDTKEAIKELQEQRERNLAAETKIARKLPESERAAALAKIVREPSEQQRAAEAVYAKRVTDLEVLKKSLQKYDPSTIDESLRKEAEELHNELIKRIAERPRPPLGAIGGMNYAKKEAELAVKTNTLRNLRNAIELRADRRARERINAKRKDAKDAQKAEETSVQEKLVKERAAVSKQIEKIVNAKQQTDERMDNVGIRVKNSRARNTEIPTFSGFYDAPLANHKSITAEGVKLATALIRAAEKPNNVVKQLEAVAPANALDAFVKDALKTIDFLLGVNEEDDQVNAAPSKIRLDLTAGNQNTALLTYVANVVDAAIEDRLKLRYQASEIVDKSTVEGISQDDLVKRASVVANQTLNKLLSATKLSGKTLRKIDFAALSIVRRDFVRYLDWQRARNILNQFGTLDVEDDAATKVDIPRILVPLLLPAAIERTKISRPEKVAPKTDIPWAVAHRQDAPQALRISEIVERFALTGGLPLMSETAAKLVSPFVQYQEIRASNDRVKKWIDMQKSVLADITKQENIIAEVETNKEIDEEERATRKETAERKLQQLEEELDDLRSKIAYPFDENTSLSALGRLRTFDDRVAALKSLGVTRQRVSFGNGLHYSQPFGCDLLLAALCAKLMQIYLSVQNAFDGEKIAGLSALWNATQTGDEAIAVTQKIAQIPDAKERLWAHLSMFYVKRGTKLDSPVDGVASLPVWQCMRPVDIRVLALVLLGFDVSSRANEDDDFDPKTMDTAYAYTRGHSAKLMYAQAYYEDFVELQFSDVPNSVPPKFVEKTESLYAVTRSPLTLQLDYGSRPWKRGAPRSTKEDIVVQLNESELNAALRAHIISAWTAPGARLITSFAVIDNATTIGDQVQLFVKGLGPELVLTALMKAAATGRANPLETTLVDHPWLLIPRCVIIGALVRLSTNPRVDKPYPGRLGMKAARKQRLLSTIERVLLLCDDAGHLLRSDGWRVSGQDLTQLDGVPIVPIPAVEFVATDAAVPSTASLPSTVVPSVINIDDWVRRLVRAHASLFGYDNTITLVGTSRTTPYTEVEWPFSPVPSKMALLTYTHSVAFLDASLNDAWAAVKSVMGVVSSAFTSNNVLATIEQSTLSPQQKILASLIARSELKRREVWTISAAGALTNTSQTRSISETDARNSPYQNWYVLFMSALLKDASPKDALSSFLSRHEGEPKVGALALAESLVNGTGSSRIKSLQVEQIVPLYETLLYYFQTDSAEPYLLTQRHTLWPLLMAPLYERPIVCTSTTAMRDALTGMDLCTVQLASLDAKKAPRAYLPMAAFEGSEAFEEANRIPIADGSRVTILHEHQFAKLEEKDRAIRAASAMTTLARVKLAVDSTELAVFKDVTTVADVLQHAFEQETAYIINTSIPLPSKK